MLLSEDIRLSDRPIMQLCKSLVLLAEAKNYETLWKLREKLHGEMIEDARGKEVLTIRLNAIQWRLEKEYERVPVDDKAGFILTEFWRGSELFKEE